MKLKRTLLLLCIVLAQFNVFAQTEDEPFNISFAIGTASMTGTMAGNFELYNNSSILNYRGVEKLAYSLHLDYAMGEVISLGASFNHNKLDMFLNEGLANETKYTGACTTLGARFLFHLRGRKTADFDPFLGIGYGLMVWSYDSKDVVAVGALATKINSMIPITLGFRYYISDGIGVSTELSTARASRINLGLNYRF